MAARLLTRSQTLGLTRFAGCDRAQFISGHCSRGLSTLSSTERTAPAPLPTAANGSALTAPFSVRKILGYEHFSQISSRQPVPFWFSARASNRSMMNRSSDMNSQIVKNVPIGVGVQDSEAKESGNTKVIAFSPLEATLGKARKSELVKESQKVKNMERAVQITYYLVPILLLASKSAWSTSLLVGCVYFQVYCFYKEIFLDYIHNEVTRNWVLLYFKLLLLIAAKDTILYFNL